MNAMIAQSSSHHWQFIGSFLVKISTLKSCAEFFPHFLMLATVIHVFCRKCCIFCPVIFCRRYTCK